MRQFISRMMVWMEFVKVSSEARIRGVLLEAMGVVPMVGNLMCIQSRVIVKLRWRQRM